MLVETFNLREDREYVKLTVFAQTKSPEIPLSNLRPMVVVCPGGGYAMTSDREAEPVAFHFLNSGFNVAIVRYSVGADAVHPAPLVDLSKALRIIRENHEKYFIDPDKIAVCGFSAGGHLVAMLGVHWNDPTVMELSGCSNEENKPNALILGYPVISADFSFTHAGSIVNNSGLSEVEFTEEKRNYFSCEKNVGPHTPPTFIVHTRKDQCVPVNNALVFTNALCQNNIDFELHIFQNGPHGLSVADRRTTWIDKDFAKWTDMASSWLWNRWE